MKYRVIELTQGFVAIIDAEDWKRVKKYKWHVHFSRGRGRAQGQPYARASIDGKKVSLHRFIVQAQPGSHVDHDNWQTLDCRKENLIELIPAANLARVRRGREGRKGIERRRGGQPGLRCLPPSQPDAGPGNPPGAQGGGFQGREEG